MNTLVCIRNMIKADIESVSRLLSKLVSDQTNRDEYFRNSKISFKMDFNQYYKKCLDNSKCHIFVAEYKESIIGFSELWFREKDFFFNIKDYAYVLHGFVDREIKTKNPLYVPLKLFQACENKAKEYGYDYIGGDVFEFNKEMKTLLKFYNVNPYRTRYIKRLGA